MWDTNVLIDYLEHGHEIWEGETFATPNEDYSAELEGLSLLINLWMRRDIRFHVLPDSISDAKRSLSAERAYDGRERSTRSRPR